MGENRNDQLVRSFCTETMALLLGSDYVGWYLIRDGKLIIGLEEIGTITHELETALKLGPRAIASRAAAFAEGTVGEWPGVALESGMGDYPEAFSETETRRLEWVRYACEKGLYHEHGDDIILNDPE